MGLGWRMFSEKVAPCSRLAEDTYASGRKARMISPYGWEAAQR